MGNAIAQASIRRRFIGRCGKRAVPADRSTMTLSEPLIVTIPFGGNLHFGLTAAALKFEDFAPNQIQMNHCPSRRERILYNVRGSSKPLRGLSVPNGE